MAEKRPLCLYTGNIKQLQPGDTILGAYNATEAGWIVNASGWLVATPGSTKTVDRTVCGTVTPVSNGGLKIVDNNDGIVLRTAAGAATDWSHVGLGSAVTPQYALHINTKGSGAREISFTNDTTGHTNSDGVLVGLDSSEQAYFWNYENSKMYFGTNNLQRVTITAGGVASINTLRSGAFHGLSTASVDGAVTSGGALVGRSTASLDSTLDVGGALVGRSTASIDSNITGGGTLTITGAIAGRSTASIDSSLDVGGALVGRSTASIDSNLLVGGYHTLTGAFVGRSTASIDSTLDVGGAAVFRSTASIDGNAKIGGDLTVTGTLVTVATAHIIGDNIIGDNQTDTQTLYGNILVYNDAAANPMRVTGNASVSGTGYVAGTFGVGGAVHLKSTASIDGVLTTGGNVNFGASINDQAVFFGNASVNGNLVVGGTGAFGNTVTITQDVQVDAGRYLYLDGGLDTYITASNDVITLHTNSASVMHFRSTVAHNTVAASIDGNLTYGGALSGPSAQITSLDVTTATIPTLNGAVNFPGAVTMRSTASIDSNVTMGGTASIAGNTQVHGTFDVTGAVTHDSTQTQTGILTANANVVVNATVIASAVIIGGAGKARLVNCTLNASGDITADGGTDLMLNQHDDTSPNQEFIAEKVWNAVYNDVVDWQDLMEGEKVTYGKVYADSYDGAFIPDRRCQQGVMGICSDTFGFAVGRIQGRTQIPVSVAGWCLAYVDKKYPTGVPLTNTSSGCLTEMNASEKALYPERIVALYKRPETEEVWQGKVEVKGRHWVQVK